MFGRNHRRDEVIAVDDRRAQAREALHKSVQEYYELQDLKPAVEETVTKHRTLQIENHFAERMWLAYRGEYSK